VQHDRRPHAGAHVGGAGSKIAQLFAKGIIQGFFQAIIDFVDDIPGFLQRQARQQALNPQVVFLVDHDADNFVVPQDNRPGLRVVQEFRTDQVFIH
jgi:hypothetical protein